MVPLNIVKDAEKREIGSEKLETPYHGLALIELILTDGILLTGMPKKVYLRKSV
jgi:hypothetical protein